MKFGYLVLRKINKFVAIRCQILRLNAQNSISPQASLEDLTAIPRPKLDLRGLLLREGRGNGKEWEGREEAEVGNGTK